MKANPFLIGGAALGGAALIAALIKAFTQGRTDTHSRLVSTLPRRTITSELGASPTQSTVQAFLPAQPTMPVAMEEPKAKRRAKKPPNPFLPGST